MLIALALTLVLALTVLRRVLEPACPVCAAKNWSGESAQLTCCGCGWSSAPIPTVETVTSQYELGFQG